MTRDAVGGPWFAWVRELAFVVALVGATWVIASAIGDVKVEVAGVAADVARNAVLIERNAEAIDRNAQAIERNAQAIDRNAQAIGEVKESMARLAGQYAEHTREHRDLASR